MEKKSWIRITAAVLTALISAIILYMTLIVGSLIEETALVGIFLASMFSHLTVLGRDMFVPAFLPLTTIYHPFLLGLSAGIGGAIGELTTYYWGLGISEVLEEKERKNLLSKWIEKYGLIATLLVAASPLPDTPIVLLAGSNRFPLRKLLIVEVIGKTIYYSLGAVVGGFFFTGLSGYLEELTLSTIIVAASVVICVATSWRKSREKVLQVLRRLLT